MTTSKATKPVQSTHYGVVVGYTSLSSTVSTIAHECMVEPSGTKQNGEPVNELQMGAFNAFGGEGDKGRLWAGPMALVRQFAERVMAAFIREAIKTWDGDALPEGFEEHMSETARLKYGKPLTEAPPADKDEIAKLKEQLAAALHAQVTSEPNAK